jgi:2-phosphoglycerate kinase
VIAGAAVKVVLIGGTSHVGKSTIARELAAVLGWAFLSTDQLARHPGRPWRDDASRIPADVVDHYATHSTAELVEAVNRHYRENVWPIVSAIVRSHVKNPFDPGLVLEGSAILPECVATASLDGTRWLWLRAPEPLVTERILGSSGYAGRSADQQQLIDAFLARALQFQRHLASAAERCDMQQVDATDPALLEKLLVWSRGGPL